MSLLKSSVTPADPFLTGEAWRHFLSLESTLSNFVEYVPLDTHNRKVFSPKLGSILLSAATQIEATFKAIIRSSYLESDDNIDRGKLRTTRRNIENNNTITINDYKELLNRYFHLSRRKVVIRQPGKIYKQTRPFLRFGVSKTPIWWTSHNRVKHSFYDNIRHATFQRTFTAVAALFLVHVMHLNHRNVLVDLGVIRSGRKGSKVSGFDPSYLKQLVHSSPRKIERPVTEFGIIDIWAETKFFEIDLLS